MKKQSNRCLSFSLEIERAMRAKMARLEEGGGSEGTGEEREGFIKVATRVHVHPNWSQCQIGSRWRGGKLAF